MITTDFRTLPVTIYRLAPETQHPGDAGSCVQCSETMGTIASAVALINEIEGMHDDVVCENAGWLAFTSDEFRPANMSVGGRLPPSLEGKVSPERVLRFRTRETILIGSYVVSWHALSRILAQEYQYTIQFWRSIAPEEAPTEDAMKASIRARQQEAADMQRLRHKVYAHTAFGDPRLPEDHPGVELTSLLMFTGEDYYM